MSAVHILIQLLREMGFSISYDKVEGPATRVTFVGIVVDSVSFTLELPQQMLNEFYTILLQFTARKCASLCQLQQLAGHLNWAGQAVRGGRCYLRCILDVIKLAHHKIVLSESFYADIYGCSFCHFSLVNALRWTMCQYMMCLWTHQAPDQGLCLTLTGVIVGGDMLSAV